MPRDEDLPMSAPAKSAAVRPTTRDLGPGLRRARRIQAKRASAQLVEAGGDARVRAAKKVARKRDLSTYLSMYFRDMSALDVLRPEKEFVAAREIEQLEIALWQQLLSCPATVGEVLILVEERAPGLTALRRVRRLADQLARGDRKAGERLAAAATAVAPALREADVDKLYVDAALLAAARISRRVGDRRVATRAVAEWLRQVDRADRGAREARNAFVKANLRLVVSIARRFNHGRMALADLIQEGNLGLMKAVERYDYRRGFRFSTYASWWIRHAISRALADKGREIRLPVHMIDAQHRLTKARRQLVGELGRQPTTEELAVLTKMPADKIEKMRSWVMEQSVSLDRPVADEEGRVLGEVLEDPDREVTTVSEDMAAESMTQEVVHLLRELRPIEADILSQRFGLASEQELTLKEIGDKYNLSRERIRQLQEQALAKMRRAMQRRDLI